MSDDDFRKIRINNRVALRFNLDPCEGLYIGARGTIMDIVYLNSTQLDRGIKSLIIKFDNSDRPHIIDGIKSEDWHLEISNCITSRSLIFPLRLEFSLSPYHS